MRPLPTLFLATALSAFCGAAAPTIKPDGKAARPTEPIAEASCVTAECHANIKSFPALHGPVNVNTCNACHALVDAKKHSYELPRQKSEMCTYCHEFDTGDMPIVHKPVTEGECLGCHDPHGGKTMSLLRGESVAELCARCHEPVSASKKALHAPVKAGECDSCHPSHASRFPKLLNVQGEDLCLSCHIDFQSRLLNNKFRHKALNEGCVKCHDVHGSDNALALLQPVPELCLSCHDSLKSEVTQATYKHSVVMKDRACLTCHTSHGSDIEKLMVDLPSKTCMTCHNEPVKADKGRVIAAVPEISDPTTIKHGPIKAGHCSGCHTAHGGDKPLLLAGAYPDAFYLKFSPDQFELCFNCHDPQFAQQPSGKGLTGFRNGDRNLHYIHVTNASARGRNCRVCHSTHASKNDVHIRDWIAYKKWQLPINFTKTATGGACASGCHSTYSYDRDNPVARPTTAPVIRTAPKLPPVRSEPTLLHWTGVDVSGIEVEVPDLKRPTLLVLMRADQIREDQVLKAVAQVVPDEERAQVVVVLCGKEAAEQAQLLVAAKKVSWPVVPDADYDLSRRMGLHVWPTVVVVQSDGAQLTRMGGAPQSLATELSAWLDLAARKIDRATLDQRLAKQNPWEEEPARRAGRLLQMGQRLLNDNNPDAARRLLAEALRIQPDSTPVQAALIAALTQLNRPKEAADLLAKLAPNVLPPWQEALLRARVMIVTNKWDQAKVHLLESIKQNPDVAETHYLLAQYYERSKDFPKAAEEYRAAHDKRLAPNRQ
jgi:predicted CXXCH cytochrome family protein